MLADDIVFMTCDGVIEGGICGVAGELVTSGKGTIHEYVIVILGSRMPTYDNGTSPLCHYVNLFLFNLHPSLLLPHHDGATGVNSLLPLNKPSAAPVLSTIFQTK